MTELKDVYLRKVRKSFLLLESSIHHLEKIDVKTLETPEELEVLDALISRFERFIEVVLNKYAKTIELEETGVNEGTLRDRLNLLEKMGLISKVSLWLEMRGLRNKLAHEYIENAIFDFYEIITRDHYPEIKNFMNSIG